MKHLLYKDLNLAINKFFFILPLLLAALMFIPNWIYTIVFMYFFWISMPQIFGTYIANRDYQMTASLPVSRREIVLSKMFSIFVLEAVHFVLALIFGLIHNAIYGSMNFFFDINLSFFGLMFVLFGIYNLSFFPTYFKTAYHFGRPAIYGVIATLVFGFAIEYGIVQFQWMKDVFEGNLSSQILPFAISLVVGVILNVIAIKRSQNNFKNVDL